MPPCPGTGVQVSRQVSGPRPASSKHPSLPEQISPTPTLSCPSLPSLSLTDVLLRRTRFRVIAEDGVT